MCVEQLKREGTAILDSALVNSMWAITQILAHITTGGDLPACLCQQAVITRES